MLLIELLLLPAQRRQWAHQRKSCRAKDILPPIKKFMCTVDYLIFTWNLGGEGWEAQEQ